MLKDYEINKPVLETDRLIIRSLHYVFFCFRSTNDRIGNAGGRPSL